MTLGLQLVLFEQSLLPSLELLLHLLLLLLSTQIVTLQFSLSFRSKLLENRQALASSLLLFLGLRFRFRRRRFSRFNYNLSVWDFIERVTSRKNGCRVKYGLIAVDKSYRHLVFSDVTIRKGPDSFVKMIGPKIFC